MFRLLSLEKDTLGEACGIFAGDGSIYATARSYILEIRSTRDETQYYRSHVKPLFEKVFGRELKLVKRKYQNGYVICIRVCGGQAMKTFHTYLQFPIGRKAHALRMPKLIFNNHEYWKAYVRGMFDASGSLYLRRTSGKYRNPVIEISSPSLAHLMQLKEILRDLDFHFWLEKSNFKLRLAGRKNVERFFKEVNPHNNAKRKKFAEIMRTRK